MLEQEKKVSSQQWTTIVNADQKSAAWTLKEMAQYKDLLYVLVKKELFYSFKQTALGPAWIILNPIVSTLVFALILGYFAKIQTNGVPILLFYLTGNIIWNYFANAFTNTSNTLMANTHILTKVYIPKIILPLASSITALVKFMVVVLVVLPVFIYYAATGKAHPNAWLWTFPLLLLLLFLITMGIGMAFSAFMIKRRDLAILIPFITSIGLFVSPVLYPASLVPEHLLPYYTINPLCGIIECFRYGITGTGNFSPYMLFSAIVTSSIIFICGRWLFKSLHTTIPDYI